MKTRLLFLLLVLALLIGLAYPKIKRLLVVNSFFEPDVISTNFQDAEELFPSTHIPASTNKLKLPEKLGYQFPASFSYQGSQESTAAFITDTRTEGLMVIHRDTVIYENYNLGLEPEEKHISWSMAKSFIGTLIGIAYEQGLIELDKQVEDYLTDFKGTGYEGVTVEDLLQMRSGVRFDEDYGDFNSDINRFGRAFALGSSYRDFAKSLKNEVPPGSRCQYVSLDTQMLGFLLMKVTGRTITELLAEWMWEPMGMENGGGWIIDNEQEEMALGGLTASLRDFAKLGLLYLNEGTLNGNKIVSSAWIKKASSVYDNGSGNKWNDTADYGYGYQWWIPPHSTGDYFAVGIYDQFVYVHPTKELVIAKLSADPRFKTDGVEIKRKHIHFFQEVAKTFAEVSLELTPQ